MSNKILTLEEQINKTLKFDGVFRINDEKHKPIPCISCGIPGIDAIMGGKGVPKGKFIALVGQESSAKSSLAYSFIAAVQANGGSALLLDAEESFNIEYAWKLGVDTDNLLISQPEHGEQAFDIIETAIQTGKIDIVVIDSIPMLVPKAVLEGDVTEANMGLDVRELNRGLKKIKAAKKAHNPNLIVVMINQLRAKIGFGYNPFTSPGGYMLRYITDVKLELSNAGQLKRTFNKQEINLGFKCKIYCSKNRVIVPFKRWEGEFIFLRGYCSKDYHKKISNINYLTDSEIWNKQPKCNEFAKSFDKLEACKSCLRRLVCKRYSSVINHAQNSTSGNIQN